MRMHEGENQEPAKPHPATTGFVALRQLKIVSHPYRARLDTITPLAFYSHDLRN